MNLINNNGFLHRNNAKRFILAVYDYANGRINSVNRSCCLKFTELKIGHPSHYLTGERMLDHIEINLNAMETIVRKHHYGDEQEEQVKGFIIHVVLHELAHMDQAVEFGQDNKTKKEYQKRMENANDTYTFNWIIKHKEELVKRFGHFLLNLAYTVSAYAYDNRFTYKRISSVSEVLKSLLYFLSNVDIEKLIQTFNSVFILMILKLRNGAHFRCLILGKYDDSPVKIRKIRDLLTFLDQNVIQKNRVFTSKSWLEYDEHIVLKPDNKPGSRTFHIPFLVITLEESNEEAKTFTIEYKK